MFRASNILSMPTHANPLISDKSVPVTALGNQVAVQEICGCCSHSCLNNQPLRISTWRSDTPLQMAQPRSWVQTPAAHWSRQIPTTPQNPIMYVRTPVQHMTVPMVPMVRPSVVRPPGVRPPVAQPMHPPAPRWIYAAGLKQRSAQSTPGANAVPKVVAVNVGAPQAKKDNLWSRDVRLPRTGWKRCVGLEPFRAFWLVQFFPSIVFFVFRCTCCVFLIRTWNFHLHRQGTNKASLWLTSAVRTGPLAQLQAPFQFRPWNS